MKRRIINLIEITHCDLILALIKVIDLIEEFIYNSTF